MIKTLGYATLAAFQGEDAPWLERLWESSTPDFKASWERAGRGAVEAYEAADGDDVCAWCSAPAVATVQDVLRCCAPCFERIHIEDEIYGGHTCTCAGAACPRGYIVHEASMVVSCSTCGGLRDAIAAIGPRCDCRPIVHPTDAEASELVTEAKVLRVTGVETLDPGEAYAAPKPKPKPKPEDNDWGTVRTQVHPVPPGDVVCVKCGNNACQSVIYRSESYCHSCWTAMGGVPRVAAKSPGERLWERVHDGEKVRDPEQPRVHLSTVYSSWRGVGDPDKIVWDRMANMLAVDPAPSTPAPTKKSAELPAPAVDPPKDPSCTACGIRIFHQDVDQRCYACVTSGRHAP